MSARDASLQQALVEAIRHDVQFKLRCARCPAQSSAAAAISIVSVHRRAEPVRDVPHRAGVVPAGSSSRMR